MKALIVAPGCDPREGNIANTLKTLQDIVGGYIEVICPFGDRVALICNEEGKLLGLPANRTITNGAFMDVIVGTFILVAAGEEDFESLTDKEIEKYTEMFRV